PRLEAMWAIKASDHAEVYFNLISSVDPKFLKLTKVDDKLYTLFRETFKDLDIKLLKTEDLKSDEAKEVCLIDTHWLILCAHLLNKLNGMFLQRWRPFCNQFEGIVEDFNYGTLLRLDTEKEYTEENTIF
ncbi:hypothetical protein NL108_009266, partial [Boleophthalmus pectinirostris]